MSNRTIRGLSVAAALAAPMAANAHAMRFPHLHAPTHRIEADLLPLCLYGVAPPAGCVMPPRVLVGPMLVRPGPHPGR